MIKYKCLQEIVTKRINQHHRVSIIVDQWQKIELIIQDYIKEKLGHSYSDDIFQDYEGYENEKVCNFYDEHVENAKDEMLSRPEYSKFMKFLLSKLEDKFSESNIPSRLLRRAFDKKIEKSSNNDLFSLFSTMDEVRIYLHGMIDLFILNLLESDNKITELTQNHVNSFMEGYKKQMDIEVKNLKESSDFNFKKAV